MCHDRHRLSSLLPGARTGRQADWRFEGGAGGDRFRLPGSETAPRGSLGSSLLTYIRPSDRGYPEHRPNWILTLALHLTMGKRIVPQLAVQLVRRNHHVRWRQSSGNMHVRILSRKDSSLRNPYARRCMTRILFDRSFDRRGLIAPAPGTLPVHRTARQTQPKLRRLKTRLPCPRCCATGHPRQSAGSCLAGCPGGDRRGMGQSPPCAG
jgi:hypothetical protein